MDEIYYNFEKKYLKKSKIESVYSIKNLRKDTQKSIEEDKSEIDSSISDSLNISRKRNSSILYNSKHKDNSIEYPALALKRSSRSFQIEKRKNQINLANILQKSTNLFDKQ